MPPFVSGTRLRARVWDGGDGARAFQSWFDSETRTHCEFELAEDDRYRCLPRTTGSVLYLDAACTLPVVDAREGCTTEAPFGLEQLWTEGRPACAPRRRRVYRQGPRVSDGATLYARGAPNGDCERLHRSPGRATFAAIPVPPQTFVAARRAVSSFGERIGALTLRADDGAAQWWRSFDMDRWTACAQFPGTRCLPPGSAWVSQVFFADPGSCSQPVAFSDDEACFGPPQLAYDSRGRVLTTSLRVSNTVLREGEACWVQVPGPAWHVGEPAPPSEAPEIPPERFGRGGFAVTYARGEIGAEVRDRGRDSACEILAIGGATFCVPASGIVNTSNSARTFADARCTAPIFEVRAGTSVEGLVLTVPRDAYDPDCRSTRRAVLNAPGAPHPGPVFRQNAVGVCEEIPRWLGTDYYQLGPAVEDPPFLRVFDRVE